MVGRIVVFVIRIFVAKTIRIVCVPILKELIFHVFLYNHGRKLDCTYVGNYLLKKIVIFIFCIPVRNNTRKFISKPSGCHIGTRVRYTIHENVVYRVPCIVYIDTYTIISV